MGCDFTLRIEILVGGVWIPVLNFGTKTGCGGYPLAEAARLYCFRNRITIGKYGTEFPTIDSCADAVVKDCYFRVQSNASKEAKSKTTNENEEDEMRRRMRIIPLKISACFFLKLNLLRFES